MNAYFDAKAGKTPDSNTKHTPGPWKYEDEEGCKAIKGGKMGSSKQAQYRKIAFTTGLHDEERDEANAKLIAAAPEMLEALIAMKEAHSHIGGIGRDMKKLAHDKAFAAIKKATE